LGTTVRVRGEDKEKLERLRALATLSSGSKVTQEDLLGLLLDEALSRGEEFLAGAFGPKLPLSDAEFEKILGLVTDWGVETSSEEIDQTLYGSPLEKKRKK
jgi:hypothetical protein